MKTSIHTNTKKTDNSSMAEHPPSCISVHSEISSTWLQMVGKDQNMNASGIQNILKSTETVSYLHSSDLSTLHQPSGLPLLTAPPHL